MSRYQTTQLWQVTLAPHPVPDVDADAREQLRAAFERFRTRAAQLAAEIAIDLPDFTVHDISHLDALWEMAQLVVGPNYPLTPAESFVLGGSFLIHDLGMGLAAYPEGVSELKMHPIWHDTVAALLKQSAPSTPDVDHPAAQVEKRAIQLVLRALHAKHAERLALICWKDRTSGSSEHYLIDDPVLRETYGPIIGLIAHSHWWNVDDLPYRLPHELGAPGGLPNGWTVDPLKLACVLRIADATHLDERRAPGFLRALRKPTGVSSAHWIFQERLYQPRLDGDRLVYTAKKAFSVPEAAAWWTCFDTLQMVDSELRHVDALLADKSKPRLAARGVAFTEEPRRLARVIQTSDWEPIDARVRVGNVAKLVGTLGGEQLYGRNVCVPLRELVQNACDAVRARRVLENRPVTWGDVWVREGRDGESHWVEVEDCGIGMSADVLAGPFLDFGASFWGSPLMHKELPTLESRGFSSTGRFGIGFFSVFMWGDRVEVFTRRPDRAREDTLVLEFVEGLTHRPLLRKARPSEALYEGGTRIRVYLRDSRTLDELYGSFEKTRWTLDQRCAWLCPTIDANLHVQSNGSMRTVVVAADWITLDGQLLLQRLLGPRGSDITTTAPFRQAAEGLQTIVNSSGDVIGRACIYPPIEVQQSGRYRERLIAGLVTVGGFRSCDLTWIFGVLVGKPHVATRNIAIPLLDGDTLGTWSSRQGELLTSAHLSPNDLVDCAEVVRYLGGDVSRMPVAQGARGWCTLPDIKCVRDMEEVFLVQDAALSVREDRVGKIILRDHVFAVAMGTPGVLQTRSFDVNVDWPSFGEREEAEGIWPEEWRFQRTTLEGAVIQAVADTWGVSLAQTLACAEATTDDEEVVREIGATASGQIVTLSGTLLRRPKLS